MPLNIIYGRNMIDKTQYCIERAAQNLPRPAFILVPEQFSFTAEKLISKRLGVQGLGGIEILSFKSLAKRFLSVSRYAGAEGIDACKKIVILNHILLKHKNEFRSLSKSALLSGTAEKIADTISEFKKYNITEEELFSVIEAMPENVIKTKLCDIASIYSYYNAELSGRFSDQDDDFLKLAKLIDEDDILNGTDIYIDHFDGFTPSEEACIRAMMKYNLTITLGMDAEDCIRDEFFPITKTRDSLIKMAEKQGVLIKDFKVAGDSAQKRSSELQFLSDQYFCYPCKKYEEKTKDIRIYTAQNPLDEVRYIAEQIINLCRQDGLKFSDIAVVGRNTEEYEKYIKAVFSRYNINFFMDKRTDILNHASVVSVLSALSVVCEGYSFENIFGYIKSGFCPVTNDETELLENYVLAAGVRGAAWEMEEDWNMRLSVYNESDIPDKPEEYEIKEADRIRRVVTAPLILLRKELKDGKTAGEKCVALYNFIKNIDMDNKIRQMAGELSDMGRLSSAEECVNIYNRLIDSLDSIASALSYDNISMADFLRIMKSCLATYDAGIIPMSRDSVFVGDVGRIKGYDTKILFVMGTNDGVFPKTPSDSGILTNAERRELLDTGVLLSSDKEGKCIEEEYIIYKALSIPKNKIYFTLSGADMDGVAKRASSIIVRVKEIFPFVLAEDSLFSESGKTSSPHEALLHLASRLRQGFTEEDEMVLGFLLKNEEYKEKTEVMLRFADYKNQSGKISYENLKKLFKEELVTSVSGLERFSACPFAYFMQYTLFAQERKKASLAANNAGSFLHNFIDDFSQKLSAENISWQDVTDEITDKFSEEILQNFILRTSEYMLKNSPSCAAVFSRLRSVVKKCIKQIAEHMKRGEFEPLGYEISFSDDGKIKPLCITLPTGQRVKLIGRIDRADILKTDEGSFIRIIDYKSGKKDFNLSDVANGLNLQLAVYMTALCENDIENAPSPVKPAAILYYRLTDPVIDAELCDSEEIIEENKLRELKMKGVLLSDSKVISAMDKSIQKASDILPVRINASGELAGSLLTEKQFEYMSEHVKHIVSELSQKLLEGRTDISPYKTKETTACRYCKFKTACGFDLSVPGCRYRYVENLGFSDALTVMRGDNDEN